MFYKNILKPVLFKFDPESVHNFFVLMGKVLGSNSFSRRLIKSIYGYKGRSISKVVDGNLYETPIILSAGFDYNGHLPHILPSLSFGGVEVGSITLRPCKGNPKPRLKRLPKSRSILVNKGLRNDGVEKIISRLKDRPAKEGFVLGVSIARTNDPVSSSAESGVADYVGSFRRLVDAGIGDYYTLNISCPNAYGGETFTTPELLQTLLSEIERIPTTKPLYVKMPINLDWDKFDELLQTLDVSKVKGVVIGNLNKDYSYLHESERMEGFKGGISGAPCMNLSNNLIKKTREKYGKRFTIIGCGGIISSADALEKFNSGADLIQLITGMIYSGPGLIKEICEAYSESNHPTKP